MSQRLHITPSADGQSETQKVEVTVRPHDDHEDHDDQEEVMSEIFVVGVFYMTLYIHVDLVSLGKQTTACVVTHSLSCSQTTSHLQANSHLVTLLLRPETLLRLETQPHPPPLSEEAAAGRHGEWCLQRGSLRYQIRKGLRR